MDDRLSHSLTLAGQHFDVAVVVPVYRSAGMLETLYQRLVSVLEAHTRSFEVIFVEDCGGDNSWEVIQGLAAKDARIKGIKLNRNFGQHNAILCGIREVTNPVVITMDDDLQHQPEDIPELLRALQDNCDVVYGSPIVEQHGYLRDFASILTKMVLQNIMGAKTARKVSAFRVFRTDLRDAFAAYQSPVVSIDALLTWSTDKIEAVQVNHTSRAQGQSGYSFLKLLNHAFNLMTSFTVLPLRVASLIGSLFILLGVLILAWVLGNYFLSSEARVPGFAFLASMIAIFSGVQLFSLGIFGEYLARIHYKTMNQPSYVVRTRTDEENGLPTAEKTDPFESGQRNGDVTAVLDR